MKHILIVEDLQDVFENLERKLQQEYPNVKISVASDCDKGLQVIENSKVLNPVDMLVLDLSFKTTNNTTILKDGKALLSVLKNEEFIIPTVVYSSHDDSVFVFSVIDNFKINGYVVKSHNSYKELLFAIDKAQDNNYFYSHSINKLIQKQLKFKKVINDLDLVIIEKLLYTTSKKEWENSIINPSSPSGYYSYNTIKERIDKLKVAVNVDNDKQLVLKLKQIGFL